MSEPVFFTTISLFLGTIVITVGIKYLAATLQARSRAASEQGYRELAEKASAVQSGCLASLSAIQSEISDIGARLTAVEKILKQVE